MRRSILPCLVSLACLTPAMARAQGASAPVNDPFESLNRKSFALSLQLDRFIVGPLARVSAGLTPAPIEKAIHNIIINLSEPMVILNNVLQGRPQGAIKAATRLVVNSTFGVAGVLDLAAGAGLRYEPNGFGDTLGRYGVHPGPYVFVPLVGPSDFRDLVGRGVDAFSTPLFYVSFPYNTEVEVGLAAMGGLDERANAGPELHALLDSAADPYATLRSTYLQSRQAEILGGNVLPPLPDIEGPSEATPLPDVPSSGLNASPSSPPPTPGVATSDLSPSPPPTPATPSGPEPRSPDPAPA